jgi:hypothetical protein
MGGPRPRSTMWPMESLRTVGTSAAWLIAPVSSQMPAVIARRWAALLLAARAISLAVALGLLAVEGLTERELVLGLAGGRLRGRVHRAGAASPARPAPSRLLGGGRRRRAAARARLGRLAQSVLPPVADGAGDPRGARVAAPRRRPRGRGRGSLPGRGRSREGPSRSRSTRRRRRRSPSTSCCPRSRSPGWPTPPTCCGCSIASAPARRSWPSRPSVAGSPGSCTTPRSSGCMRRTCC